MKTSITDRIIEAEQKFITEYGMRPGKVELGSRHHNQFKKWLEETGSSMMKTERSRGLPQRIFYRGMEVVRVKKPAGIEVKP